MLQMRRILLLGLFATVLSGFVGCGNDPDKTGTGDTGFGPPGVNATNAPQTPEEMIEAEKKQDAESKKFYRNAK